MPRIPERMDLFKIHPGLVDRSYTMNPKRETLIGGGDLENGMSVLIAADINRYSLLDLTDKDVALVPSILVTNRWCTVTNLRRIGSKIHFTGGYQDGNTHPRIYSFQDQWLVKKTFPLMVKSQDEIEGYVSTAFAKGIQRLTDEDRAAKREKITELVKGALAEQRQNMFVCGESDESDMAEVIENTVNKIMEL